MRISWLKVSSRVAVIALVYLLLSIPDSKFLGEESTSIHFDSVAYYTESLITGHAAEINYLGHDEKINISDSLNNTLGAKILNLKSELFDSNSEVIDTITFNFALLASVVSRTDSDVLPTLNNLWQWRNLIKQQSLFWNTSSEDVRVKTASILSFVNYCEEYIAINRGLSFTVAEKSRIGPGLEHFSSKFKAGDIVLTSEDTSYPYFGLSKVIPDFTPTLHILSQKGDSTYYIGSTPFMGLKAKLCIDQTHNEAATWIHLRLSQYLPELISNPTLPELAADLAYNRANQDKSNYDYLFVPLSYGSIYEAELMSFAYADINSTHILPFSSIQDQNNYGLNSLGIRNLDLISSSETQFSPYIDYVGIMRNGPELSKRNIELAAEMACFSLIDHDLVKSLRWQLPKYRVLNGISRILKLVNGNTIIPNGMASETALVYDYITKQKLYVLPRLEKEVDVFVKNNEYFPTYPELLDLAKSILASK